MCGDLRLSLLQRRRANATLFCLSKLTQEYSVSELDGRADCTRHPSGRDLAAAVQHLVAHYQTLRKRGVVSTGPGLSSSFVYFHEKSKSDADRDAHGLHFVHYVRCSKKIRSHPRRRVERTSSPLTVKTSEAIPNFEVEKRSPEKIIPRSRYLLFGRTRSS